MGKAIENLARGHEITQRITSSNRLTIKDLQNAEVAIDFSAPECTLHHIELALEAKRPLVIGTTAWESDREEARELVKKKGGHVLFSPNFSIGIALFLELAARAAELLKPFEEYDIQGIEAHHKQKKDSPSGTAKAIASRFDPPLPFTSIRMGDLAGTHMLLADSHFDTLTLTHQAKSRDGFAKGALFAAEWLLEKAEQNDKEGWYSFEEALRTIYRRHNPV